MELYFKEIQNENQDKTKVMVVANVCDVKDTHTVYLVSGKWRNNEKVNQF